jgi:hypothetical protein
MPKAGTSTKKKAPARAKPKPKSPRCRTCGKTIRIPEGWSVGPAVRRHYWAKHREVMTAAGGSK